MSMADSVRVRFAPSPTGYMHVGGARTALFNFLFARRHGGCFLLRIEDTDRTRFQQEAMDEIYSSLEWLGLDWDEGPGREGDVGPYVQSERAELYQAHARKLLDSANAYPCFCTPERLAAMRLEQERARLPGAGGYDRHCRNLDPVEAAKKMAAGEAHVVRLKVPNNRVVVFRDEIRGEIATRGELLDDLVLLKSDGLPTYHLANVVDDHFMGITHVLRGDEWISSTPRHILIYEAFGWSLPVFAHLPVILAPGGGKLSKRHGAASVTDYRNAGFLPEALVNFLALLGWSPGEDREIMSRAEMIATFELARVSAKASVFDERKLEWMNGQYLARRDPQTLLDPVTEIWKNKGWLSGDAAGDPDYLLAVIQLLQPRSRKITELVEQAEYFFCDPREYEVKPARKHFRVEAAPRLQRLLSELESQKTFSAVELEDLYRRLAEEMEMSAGKLIHPTRLALSGVGHGPGLFELMETLGRETTLRRLRAALDWISKREESPEAEPPGAAGKGDGQ
ncbi:MAG TPA: glutamate--tRNA ligase [Candidatus Aminicenantes bacterium]|nr:glutamate--tRNA ligase [Candidatus Aminicenantes bacterium]